MPRKKFADSMSDSSDQPLRPAITPEARENQLIALSYDLVEKRLREGTASSAEVVHFLKLGSTKERLEKQILEEQKNLLVAKTNNLKSSERSEELYENALAAMRTYSGVNSKFMPEDENEQ